MPLDHECPVAGTRCPVCEPLSDQLQGALRRTWSAIASDCLAAVSESDDLDTAEMSRNEVVEVVLDCDRIEQYGYLNEEGRAELKAFRKLPVPVQVALARTVFTDEHYCF